MSEVKRYYIGVYGGEAQARVCLQGIKGLIRDSEGKHFTLADDFDRVTAERDAALGREAALREELAKAKKETIYKHAALVSKAKALTAADERADVLEGLLRTWRNGRDMTLKDCAILRDQTDAALKPAEGGGNERA